MDLDPARLTKFRYIVESSLTGVMNMFKYRCCNTALTIVSSNKSQGTNNVYIDCRINTHLLFLQHVVTFYNFIFSDTFFENICEVPKFTTAILK